MSDCISRAKVLDALDEIEAEVADGYGYQYAKWREYFVEMPSAQPKPCEDAVSRQAVKNAICDYVCAPDVRCVSNHECRMKQLISELPPAQPEPKRGKWVLVCDNNGMHFICNKCGAWRYHQEQKFCGECGADMREVTT